MLFTEVDAVRAALPNAVNLLASAVRPGDGDGRWQEGMAWRSEVCPTYQGFNPCTELETAPDEGDDGLIYHVPVAYRVKDECTLLSGRFDQDRVTRMANAIASYVVAQELWDGALTQLDPYDLPNGGATDQINHYLADGNATIVPPVGTNVIEALAAIEDAARDQNRGMQVFLHAPIYMINAVSSELRRVGNELRTATDGIVIADAGYPGTGAVTPGTSEVQTVTLDGGPTGGTFALTYDGQTTGPIAFDATAAVAQGALEGLSNLAPGDVTVTGPVAGVYTVTFNAELGNVAQMTGDGALLTGPGAPYTVTVATTAPGVAPVPGTPDWIFATGPVSVRLGALGVEVEGRVIGDFPIIGAAAPPTSPSGTVNRRAVWASRMFAVTFDPCVHFAINVAELPV